MIRIKELIDELKKDERVFIQCHNFPDHDAVASAFGLHKLLGHYGIMSHIIYKGTIQRESVVTMNKLLGIVATDYAAYDMKQNDRIIIVDGCKGNSNVDDLPGMEIAVIDHHEVEHPEDVPYIDIRPDYGACSTIIFSYFDELGLEIPQNVATALMIGLNMDTALLTRKVSEEDIKAYPYLYIKANVPMVNSILRNYIQTRDLEFYKYVIDNLRIRDRYAYCCFEHGCNQNLLGILGDFLLSLEEVEFVVLCAKNNGVVNFSVRSEVPKWNAASMIKQVLDGIGFGGGHADMAGGVIRNLDAFDSSKIEERFYELIK